MENLKNLNVVMFGLNGTRWLANRLLHAVMEEKGFNVSSVFFRENYQSWAPIEDVERELVMQVMDKLKPDLVTFSLTSFFVNEAKELTQLIKAKYNVPVLWGGIHPSLNPDKCLKYADMVCIGEGEGPLPELAESIRKGENRTDIESIWFKKDGEIIKNGNRALVDDFDSLPAPDFSNKNMYFIVDNKLHEEFNPSPYYKYEYNVLTCRGCPFMCTYCSSHKTSKFGTGKRLRKRSVENVMKELRTALADFPKIRKIYFWDDVFPYDKVWLKEFAKHYIEEIGIPFFCYIHPTLIDDERVAMLKDMGVEDVAMGFQHGSVRIRKGYFERHESDEAIIKAAKLFQKYKIDIHYDMISSPFETEQDNIENVDLLLKMPKPFTLYMHTLTFFPGYKITERALKENFITEDQVVGEDFRKEISASKKEVIENPWLCYISLMGKKVVPNNFIHFMIKNKFHYKHLKFLKFLAKLCLTYARIYDLYTKNKALLKDMEFGHFLSMFKYAKTLLGVSPKQLKKKV